jgi:hypothetical protein
MIQLAVIRPDQMGCSFDVVFEYYFEFGVFSLFMRHVPWSLRDAHIVKMTAAKPFPCYKFYALHVWANEPGTSDVGHTMGFSHVSEMLVSAFTK